MSVPSLTEALSSTTPTQWAHVVRASSINAILPPRTPRLAVAMVGKYMDTFLNAMIAFADRCRKLRFAATFKEDDIAFARDVILGQRAARLPKSEGMKQPLVWSVLMKMVHLAYCDADKRPAISKLARDAFQEATVMMLNLLQERFRVCLSASSSKTLSLRDVAYILTRSAETSDEFGTSSFCTDPVLYMDLVDTADAATSDSAVSEQDDTSKASVVTNKSTEPASESSETKEKATKTASKSKAEKPAARTQNAPAPKQPRKRKAGTTEAKRKDTPKKRTKKASAPPSVNDGAHE